MAQAKFIDDDLFSWTLEQAQGLIPEIEKKALAVGGKIIADEMKKRLRGVIADTDLVHSKYFSDLCGNEVYLKPENLQVTGAYKIRGAYYKTSMLT